MKNYLFILALTIMAYGTSALIFVRSCFAQQLNVTAQVEMAGAKSEKSGKTTGTDTANVVAWLASPEARALSKANANKLVPTVAQQNKSFVPHVVVVQVGGSIQFPNRDPFLHNVFSLHDGKQFDLGFYEAGSAKTIRFDRPGVSYLFCNIHPEMTAVVVAVETPYFSISDPSGHLTIPNVAAGKYTLHVWSERSSPDDLKNLEREVAVSSDSANLGSIQIRDNPKFTAEHKNKYGQNYEPASPGEYTRP
jgi:plastocyanin